MACGNTSGATALSSYGRFWISFAISSPPGGFNIAGAYMNPMDFNYALGFFLAASLLDLTETQLPLTHTQGWFIFTTFLL
jgi:succinate-acetate transporter protein